MCARLCALGCEAEQAEQERLLLVRILQRVAESSSQESDHLLYSLDLSCIGLHFNFIYMTALFKFAFWQALFRSPKYSHIIQQEKVYSLIQRHEKERKLGKKRDVKIES